MKRKTYFCMLLGAVLMGILAACSDEANWKAPGNEIPEGALSVAEAKASFEEQMMRMETTLNTEKLQGIATNFTPLWDHAVISGRDSMVSVDVPVVTDYLFKAIILADEPSKVVKFTEDLLQKLIVVKDLRTGNMGSYVVSIIPDKAYAESNKKVSAMDFPNYGDYSRFSGRVVYSLPLSPVPLRVNCYRNGVQVDAVTVFGIRKEVQEVQEVSVKMNSLLDGLWLKRKSRVALRSDELDGGWLDELIVVGNSDGESAWDLYLYLLSLLQSGGGSGGGGSTEPDLPDPGDMGGGGGNSSTPKTPQPRTDCPPSAATNSATANTVLNSTTGGAAQVKSNIDLLRGYAQNNSNEYALAVEKNNGQYILLNQNQLGGSSPYYIEMGTSNQVNYSYSNNTYLLAHTHPIGGNTAPSPRDAVNLISAYKGGLDGTNTKAQNIQASVILGHDGSEYMIYVNNRTQLSNFSNNSINAGFFEPNGAFFKSESIYDTLYNTAKTNLLNQGYSDNDAQSYALSYVLDFCDTGLKIYKKGSNNNFKEQKTDASVTGANVTYSPKICQ
ncbi:MAG: hypothetical protein LBH19_12310 [Dysgonamonadaceae bacterium]|nr:hypothetical protein [Dysgonamonadaceae bacterium]